VTGARETVAGSCGDHQHIEVRITEDGTLELDHLVVEVLNRISRVPWPGMNLALDQNIERSLES
jgi:hypothetical protein